MFTTRIDDKPADEFVQSSARAKSEREAKVAATEIKHDYWKWLHVENSEISVDGSPAPKWKLWYARSMIFWAVLSQVFLLIQAITIFVGKDAAGVSLAAYILYIVGTVVWCVYAAFVLAHRNWPLLLNGILGFLLSALIIVGIVLYQ